MSLLICHCERSKAIPEHIYMYITGTLLESAEKLVFDAEKSNSASAGHVEGMLMSLSLLSMTGRLNMMRKDDSFAN